METLVNFFKAFFPLLPYYPIWAQITFSLTFVFLLLSLLVFALLYPSASKAPYRQEVESRLNHIERNLGTENTSPWHDVDGGVSTAYVDIRFKTWNLAALVQSGWGIKERQSVENYFDNFKLSAPARKENAMVQRAKMSLQSVRKILQL